MGSSSEDFSVVVLASDLAVDARPFLFHQEEQQQEEDNWHDCSQYLSPDEDFSDLEQ
ncbi:ganglioside-induced differentiation-associated protein, partial [Trifolium medium]|nr:ganglioside-induced differentiation-associated protein [Trifolium medium]